MIWRRNKYHLNGVLLLLPVIFLGSFLSDWKTGPHGDDEPLEVRDVGAWRVRAYAEPLSHARAGGELDVHARLVQGGPGVRAAFLTIDETPPKSERLLEVGYSALLHGSRHLLEAHVPVPVQLSGREALWLTVEGWDGTIHQSAWPLNSSSTN